MRKITIRDRQTLFDIAVQYCGDREAVFEIARWNNLPVSAELPAGTVIIIPEVINQRVVKVIIFGESKQDCREGKRIARGMLQVEAHSMFP